MAGTNWAERLLERVKKWPIVVVVAAITVVIGGLVANTEAALNVERWVDNKFFWKDNENRRLIALRAGMDISQFEAQFGAPVFRNPDEEGELTESSFRGRAYWVQAVSDASGRVLLYAVTTCDKKFHPTFPVFGRGEVTLGETRFASAAGVGGIGLTRVDLFLGVTANSYYIESEYGGNPGLYKTSILAVNDVCEDDRSVFGLLGRSAFDAFGAEYHGEPGRRMQKLDRFRQKAIVNTYGETAPGVYLKDLIDHYQVGVNRLLIRTV